MKSEYEKAKAEIVNIRQRQAETKRRESERTVKESRRSSETLETYKNWLLGQKYAIGMLLIETNEELFAGKGLISKWANFSETEEYGVSGFEEYEKIEGVKKALKLPAGCDLCIFISDKGILVGLRSEIDEDAKYNDHTFYNKHDKFLARSFDIDIEKTREAIISTIVESYERL